MLNLKKIFFLFVTITLLVSCTKNKTSSEKQSEQKEKPIAYNIEENDIFGNNVSLSSYKGKVVLLNFWATWCPPCKAEIPDLIKLQENYKDKLAIFSVSLDQDDPKVVREFYKKYKINYPVVMFTEEILKNYGGISAIPTSFVINHKGELEGKIVGMRSYEMFVEILKPFMEQITNESND